MYLYGLDGEKYLDFGSGIGVMNTGHGHPKVIEAAKFQIENLVHACAHVSWYPTYVELAERLAKLIPDLGMSYFSNSGTESVEAAIKLARYVTRRPAIIAFQGSFHGRSLGAASLTGKASLRRYYEPLLPSVYHIPYPWCFRCSYGHTRHSCNLECYQALENALETQVHPDDLAAVIIEPILGEGGYYIAPDEFLQKLRALTSKHGVLLIVDEVQSGMGRTGKMFAWQHIENFTPDVMTLAKALGSGFPIGAILGRPEIMEKWEKGAHGSTFGGNPVSCAAALATIDILEGEGLLHNAVKVGGLLRVMLDNLKRDVPTFGDVRSRGLMLAVEIIDENGGADPDLAKRIIKGAQARGLILIGGGIRGNVVRMIPPLIIDPELAAEGFEIFLEAVKEVI
jgi:4-aminobutyrate aminotransferase